MRIAVLYTTVPLVVSALLLAPIAQAGSVGGGGGNVKIILSSVDQVEAAIENAPKKLTMLVHGKVHYFHQQGKIQNPVVTRILKKFYERAEFEGDPALVGSLKRSAFSVALSNSRIQKKQMCKGADGKVSAASVPSFTPGARICFNIPELRKVSESFLEDEVTYLLGHEMAHQFGFSENEADEFQKFLASIETSHIKHYSPNVLLSKDTSYGHVQVSGADAEAIYKSLSVQEVFSEGNEAFPPGWHKKGKDLACTRYQNPIPDDSEYANFQKKLGLKTVKNFGHNCIIRFEQDSGTVTEPW